MAEKDPFGFGAATAEADPPEGDTPEVDLAMFAPKPKAVDRSAAEAASAVAQGAGFSRRTARTKTAKPAPEPAEPPVTRPAKGARRRIPLSQAVGFEDRYPDSERAQLNVLAPLPVVLRWREIIKQNNGPAWVVLEKALDALEAQTSGEPGRTRGDQ